MPCRLQKQREDQTECDVCGEDCTSREPTPEQVFVSMGMCVEGCDAE
jgi:hypothetical protein